MVAREEIERKKREKNKAQNNFSYWYSELKKEELQPWKLKSVWLKNYQQTYGKHHKVNIPKK